MESISKAATTTENKYKLRAMKTTVLVILISILAASCFESNAIYFNINEQSIRSCNSKGISRLFINNDSVAEVYSLIWNNNKKDAPKKICLYPLTVDYVITKGWNNKEISKEDFKLRPYSIYTIERVQGDATSYKITVQTDESGTIVKAVPDECGFEK